MRRDSLSLRHGRQVDVGYRMGKHAAGNVLENTRIENVYSREHQRRIGIRLLRWLRHSTKVTDQTFARLYHTEAFSLRVTEENQSGEGLPSPVSFQRRFQIEIGDQLPIDHYEGVAL